MTDTPQQAIRTIWQRAVDWSAGLDRRTVAWGGLALATIMLLSVNVIGNTALRTAKIDLTKEGLFTTSDGTRRVLRSIEEPIAARLYFSKSLGEASPATLKYFDRVRALLDQYRDISGGRFQLQVIDPEPFSDAEDRAVAAGLRGVPLNQDGDRGYFGLAAENSTDNTSVIEFFSPDREKFLEYDLSKLVWTLNNPKKRVVGLISGIPINGTFTPQGGMTPPWTIMEQVSEFYEVKDLGAEPKSIGPEVDTLMLAQPETLSDAALYAIDQYALRGGRILAFLDPNAESSQGGRGGMMMMGDGAKASALDKLLKTWGVAFDASKIAGDITRAQRVQFGGGRQPVVTQYVPWIGLDVSNIEPGDVLANGIERINMASAGFFEKIEGATTTLTPILKTSPQAMVIDADKLRPIPDPVGLLRAYKPGGKVLVLAARLTGEAKTAFPDGLPKDPDPPKDTKGGTSKAGAAAKAPALKTDAKADTGTEPQLKTGRLNIILVGDSDMLADQFWVDVREFGGQRVALPRAHNGAFVLNALENLSGGEVLTGLRGRGIDDRRFDKVDEIRRDGERKFRETEETLQTKLKAVQEQLANVETKGDGKVILADKDRQAIENFRREMIDIRRELRDVKLAMRKDIDRLDGVLKAINIAGVPALIGLGALGLAWSRRRRQAEVTAKPETVSKAPEAAS